MRVQTFHIAFLHFKNRYNRYIMRNLQIKIMLLFAVLMFTTAVWAQTIAIKNNLLYDATTTPNLGIEIGLGKKTSGQLFYGLNPWSFGDSGSNEEKAKHWLLMPEIRWWPCSVMNGWFFGVHGMGGQFNAANVDVPVPGAFFGGDNLGKEVRDNRCEGSYLGGGVTVGYQWILSRHWNIEAEIGAGYDHVWYEKYPCAECGSIIDKSSTNYVGITKVGLSFMYVF